MYVIFSYRRDLAADFLNMFSSFFKSLSADLTFYCQAKEAKMKSKLDSLASYAMIPHGFQRHKGRIVRLAEECLQIARDGEPSTRNVAQRFVSNPFDLSVSSCSHFPCC